MKKQIAPNQKFEAGRTVNFWQCNSCTQKGRFTEECFSCKNYIPIMEQVDYTYDEFIVRYKNLITPMGCLRECEESWDALNDAFNFKFKENNLYAEFKDGLLHIQKFYKRDEVIVNLYTVSFRPNGYAAIAEGRFGQKANQKAERLASRISRKMEGIRDRYQQLYSTYDRSSSR